MLKFKKSTGYCKEYYKTVKFRHFCWLFKNIDFNSLRYLK